MVNFRLFYYTHTHTHTHTHDISGWGRKSLLDSGPKIPEWDRPAHVASGS